MVPADIARAEIKGLLRLHAIKKKEADKLFRMYEFKRQHPGKFTQKEIESAYRIAERAAQEVRKTHAEIVKKRKEAEK